MGIIAFECLAKIVFEFDKTEGFYFFQSWKNSKDLKREMEKKF